MIMIDANQLLSPERFDIPAKITFARFIDQDLDSSWGRRLYSQHLKVWNNHHERFPVKNGLVQYIESFKEIMKAIRIDKFDYKRSPLFVNSKNKMINGGHRLAAAILYGKKVGTFPVANHLGQANASYLYFRNNKIFVKEGLEEKWSDAMAIEYCRWKKNLFVATMFCPQEKERTRQIIEEHGKIVYEKEIDLKNDGPFFVMTQLYLGENWLGNFEGSFGGAKEKARFCFPDGNRKIRVFLIESNLNSMMKCKNKLRKIFHRGNHSVHINDRYEETWRLANTFFNDNSVHFLNHCRFAKFKKFNTLLDIYRKQATGLDDYCIDSSSVLSAYGIREGRDLDFLSKKPGNDIHPEITVHNEELPHYCNSLDDILYNPENHFWFNGVKFASLEVVRNMKIKRDEEKDRKDVLMIDEFLKGRTDA